MSEVFQTLFEGLGRGLAFFYDLIPSYGVAIILLTAAARLVLLPLTLKQTKSFQAMQRLQPEVKRLQAKYKGDRQKLNEEMMRLYREHQVNPLGGCLPFLVQIPVFIALYQVLSACGKFLNRAARRCAAGFVGVRYLPAGSGLREAIIAGHAGFLGMDLGQSPAAALREGVVEVIPYAVLILLMAVTTWFQGRQMMASQPGGAQSSQMQIMAKITPILLPLFSLNLPAGVAVYWVASNIWTIGQQYLLIQRKAKPETPAPAPEKPARPPSPTQRAKPRPAPGAGNPRAKSDGAGGRRKTEGQPSGKEAAGNRKQGSGAKPRPGSGKQKRRNRR